MHGCLDIVLKIMRSSVGLLAVECIVEWIFTKNRETVEENGV